MNTPFPVNPPQVGWVPTTSTVGGGLLGGALAQLLCALIDAYAVHPIGSATAAALTTVCVFAVGYFFPDGGRR